MNQTELNTVTYPDAFESLNAIRTLNPIIHNVTNFVVMQTCANVLLALGASPIMAHAEKEISEIIAIANALVINIGTLDDEWLQSIKYAQDAALTKSIPIIFDPVGAGASRYRTDAAKEILKRGVNIIRGNASEMIALVQDIKTKGIDAIHAIDSAIHAAKILAHQYHCTVVVSGEKDLIIDKHHQLFIPHGSVLFTKVTGMGCAATAVIGAFAAVNKNYFLAAAHAMTIYTLAGQLAAEKCSGPASFYNQLIDSLYSLTANDVKNII